MYCIEKRLREEIGHILYLQTASGDIELTPVFYTNPSSSSLFFRFDHYSKNLSKWSFNKEIEEWQKNAAYRYRTFINHRSYWWRIEEDKADSILIFLSQFSTIKATFELEGIRIKDCSERLKGLSDSMRVLHLKREEVIQKVEEIEKVVGISRNDIITIYELAAQCCSAYNNLIMLIDKKNVSKYVAYAKGTLKQSQYTTEIAEAKFWTDKIKSFTKPMAEFCESMNDLYQQTQGIKSKFKCDYQQPYGRATDFPLLSRAVVNLEYLVKQLPDIVTKGEDKEYIQHCRYLANKQRIY